MTTRAYRSPRREQAAAETRTAILDAAEKLFAANGYAATTVNEVAVAATVGPNTVYTSVGGKPQLVVALIERASADPLISASLDEIDALTDGAEIIKRLAAGTGATRRSQQRAVAVMLDNLTTDPLITEAAERTAALLRQRLHRTAARLTAVRALRDGTTVARATAILWFYFGFTPWRELRDLGWTWKETERWLAEQAINALINA
ncbi:MAG: TetR family transcriptional regulator [Amycolatopsis sp.]|jgi:AcrR family transcriptional regulator|uniref:TetR/AcrR family transcriptional regulator n=1 Tax=Amycolatopsis sp. TaxID=37632 RepID=UPI00260B0438|nr:TetR/AcrR family transcriptional regulator [Amycolatopsis sp.]MCU1680844.1 TetR family transcriptional regulator [Amycolatopsis sp.]